MYDKKEFESIYKKYVITQEGELAEDMVRVKDMIGSLVRENESLREMNVGLVKVIRTSLHQGRE